MKKILIIMPSMFIGGAERSLIGLLNAFDYNSYQVDLFLYRHEGEFMKYIPSRVNILPKNPKYETFDVPIKGLLFSNKCLFGIARIFSKFYLKIKKVRNKQLGVWASMQSISRSLMPLLPKIKGDYDMAISYLGIPDVLDKKVSAKIKLAWNHTDYSILGPDKKYDRIIYKNIDYIVSVSESCTNQFLKTYPEMQKKSITIQNIISEQMIRDLSNECTKEIERQPGEVILLSIGRFSEAKNFDNIPHICKLICEKGIKVKWFIIGYGGDEELIRTRIRENRIEKNVIILGKKENPYPYIKACDIYVQPSRYEGKCVSVIEAQILNKPVIITDYATSGQQLEDGVDGLIVPMDNEECAEAIVEVINSKELQKRLVDNTKKKNYTNVEEINKIYSLIS